MQAQAVSLKHLKIGPHVMRERDRLSFLQVCETRHDRLRILLHDMQYRAEQFL